MLLGEVDNAAAIEAIAQPLFSENKTISTNPLGVYNHVETPSKPSFELSYQSSYTSRDNTKKNTIQTFNKDQLTFNLNSKDESLPSFTLSSEPKILTNSPKINSVQIFNKDQITFDLNSEIETTRQSVYNEPTKLPVFKDVTGTTPKATNLGAGTGFTFGTKFTVPTEKKAQNQEKIVETPTEISDTPNRYSLSVYSNTDPLASSKQKAKQLVDASRASVSTPRAKVSLIRTEEKTKKQKTPASSTPSVPKPIIAPVQVIPPVAPTARQTYNGLPKANLFSYDTETTGVDSTKAKIWQQGYASRDYATGTWSGGDVHSDPFSGKIKSKKEFEKALAESNGKFSQDAAKKGNFKEIVKDFGKNNLVSVREGLEQTLGKVTNGSILVMQNINFENSMLREAYKADLLDNKRYKELQENMMFLSADKKLNTYSNELFQRPFEVQEYMRSADYTFTTKFLPFRSDATFSTYVSSLNSAFDSYDSILKNLTHTSKIPVVELMDISKIFLGNLAANNLIEKETSTTGLTVDFLTQAFFGRKEAHTAASDSKDTLELFESMYTHINNMRSGNITPELKQLATRISAFQPDEVNRRFISGLSSTITDFTTRGHTKLRGTSNRYYGGAIDVYDTENKTVSRSKSISIGVKNRNTTDVVKALRERVESFAKTFQDNIAGFNRESFVQELIQDFDPDKPDYDAMLKKVQATQDKLQHTRNVDLPKPQTSSDIIVKKGAFVESTFNKGTKTWIGLAAFAGLSAMAVTIAPKKQKEDKNKDLPVYSNFYDEQYLGSGFVDFRDRNKRYMY